MERQKFTREFKPPYETTGPKVTTPTPDPRARRLSPNVTALGFVGMLTAMSSAMIYGLLPVFMVRVLGISIASVGIIEGVAESAASLIKIVSGAASDRIGRRKPFVILGYTLSAVIKTIFPVAGSASAVLAARVVDRLGKGIRDAPRDAFLADLTAKEIRGEGFGLRLALTIFGFVIGPLIAIGLMKLSGGDFLLVFWIALIPAYLSVIVLLVAVKELPFNHDEIHRPLSFRRSDITALPAAFWWLIAIASLLSLARFSQAFLVLKAHDIGVGDLRADSLGRDASRIFSGSVSVRHPRGPRRSTLAARDRHGRPSWCRCGIGRCEHHLADGAGSRPLGPAARCHTGAAGSHHC